MSYSWNILPKKQVSQYHILEDSKPTTSIRAGEGDAIEQEQEDIHGWKGGNGQDDPPSPTPELTPRPGLSRIHDSETEEQGEENVAVSGPALDNRGRVDETSFFREDGKNRGERCGDYGEARVQTQEEVGWRAAETERESCVSCVRKKNGSDGARQGVETNDVAEDGAIKRMEGEEEAAVGLAVLSASGKGCTSVVAESGESELLTIDGPREKAGTPTAVNQQADDMTAVSRMELTGGAKSETAASEAEGVQGDNRARLRSTEVIVSDNSDGGAGGDLVEKTLRDHRQTPPPSPGCLSGMVAGSQCGVPSAVPGRKNSAREGWQRDTFRDGSDVGGEVESGGVVVELVEGVVCRRGGGQTIADGGVVDDADCLRVDAAEASGGNPGSSRGVGRGESSRTTSDSDTVSAHEEQRRQCEEEGEEEMRKEESSKGTANKNQCRVDSAERLTTTSLRAAAGDLQALAAVDSAASPGDGTPGADGVQDESGARRGRVARPREGSVEEAKPVSGGGRRLQPRPFTLFVSGTEVVLIFSDFCVW